MAAEFGTCGICGQHLQDYREAEDHRTRHRVPADLAAFPECLHPPLFVELLLGQVQIVPLVESASARRVPRRPWDSDTLPIPVRKVLEAQNLKAPQSSGPYYPGDEATARAIDKLFHRLGGPAVPVSEVDAATGGVEERAARWRPRQCSLCSGFHRPGWVHSSDYECPVCGAKIPFNKWICPSCGEPASEALSGSAGTDYGDYPGEDGPKPDDDRHP